MCSNVILETRGSGGSTSTTPKPSTEDPMSTADADARAVEEMADSMLWDSPIPETEEERKQLEDVPAGKSIMPFRPICTFLHFVLFFTRRIFPRPSQSGGSCGESWGNGTCGSVTCGGGEHFYCPIGKYPATSR